MPEAAVISREQYRMGTEVSWEFMRDLGLIIFAAGGALVALGFSRTLFRELGATNVTLITTIGDVMMLAGACLAVTAMVIGYLMPVENP